MVAAKSPRAMDEMNPALMAKTDLAEWETRIASRLTRLETAVFGGGAVVLGLLVKLVFFR